MSLFLNNCHLKTLADTVFPKLWKLYIVSLANYWNECDILWICLLQVADNQLDSVSKNKTHLSSVYG